MSWKIKVLLVEAEPSLLDVLAYLISRMGHEVTSTLDTDAAQTAIEGYPPDIVVTGWVGVDGPAIVETARKKGIPFVIITMSPHKVPENLREHMLDKASEFLEYDLGRAILEKVRRR